MNHEIKDYTQEELEDFGRRVAMLLQGGLLIELVGDVGAGKTTLTKAIAAGAGIDETVHSPTFTISNRYETPNGLTIAHYDFYRLTDPGVMANELAETLGDESAVTIIEWGDIVEDILPQDRLTIRIEPTSDNTRELTLKAGGPLSAKVMESL